MNRLLSTLGAGGAAPGSGNGAVLNRTVFVSLLAADGDGSADAPFGLLSEAVAALPAGGTVLVAPGNFSGEAGLVLPASLPFHFVSLAGRLTSANGQVFEAEFPLFPSFSAAGGAGGALHFEGIAFTGSHDVAATGMPVVYDGCAGIATNGSFVWIRGGGGVVLDPSVYNAVIEGADLFGATLAAGSTVTLHHCNSWGQSLGVAFPPGSPPGCFCYYDAVTAGHAGGAPTVSDGVAVLLA